MLNQKIATRLECHRHAFEFFAGVPSRMIIDNAKRAITKACYHDPYVHSLPEMRTHKFRDEERAIDERNSAKV